MMYDVIVILLFILLIISIINYNWLLNDVKKNYLYISNLNQNKYTNVNVVTYSYIYPKNWLIDKCYNENCNLNDNMFETKIKLFHNDLYKLGNNKKMLIIKNDNNLSSVSINNDELQLVSVMNSLQ